MLLWTKLELQPLWNGGSNVLLSVPFYLGYDLFSHYLVFELDICVGIAYQLSLLCVWK